MATATKENFGIKNWILLMSSLGVLNIALGTWKIENYDFITPGEFVNNFWTALKQNDIVLIFIILVTFFQINLCLGIEKLVLIDVITEGCSQAFYIINAFSTPNLFIAFCFCLRIDPVPAYCIFGLVVHLYCLKVLSYMYVNSQLRRTWIQSREKDNGKNGNKNLANGKEIQINYPESVNWKNLYLFMYISPSLVYKPDSIPWKLHISYFISALLKGTVVFYIAFNMLNIFIVKEVFKSAVYINSGDFIEVARIVLKIMLPLHLLWLLLFYYFTFCIFFESWIKGVGYPLNQDYDWWNSDTMSMFWSKWNIIVHEWFKETVYKPLLSAGVGRTTATTAVFAFSGFLHTYYFELPFRIFNGFGFIVMVLQIPLHELTHLVGKRYGSKVSNCLIWIQLMLGHPVASVLMYYNYEYVNKAISV